MFFHNSLHHFSIILYVLEWRRSLNVAVVVCLYYDIIGTMTSYIGGGSLTAFIHMGSCNDLEVWACKLSTSTNEH